MREIKFRAWDNELVAMYENVGFDNTSKSDGVLTYMQYTGLKDKNGIEIYEGDIVSWKNSYIGSPDKTFNKPVEWSGQMIFPTDLGRTEVIGNIYENPELLKGTAE